MFRIRTKDFILRPIKPSDARLYFESHQDKDSMKGFMTTPGTFKEAKKEVKERIDAQKKGSGITFAIEIDGEYAGYVELHGMTKIERYKHSALIGYCMHPKYRGRGITTKAVRLVTAYAFKNLHLRRIAATCRTFNKASARVLEKAGYTLEGILRKNKFKDGKYLDDMIWSKVR